MKGATGFGPDGARNPSSLLADPSALLRQHVKLWALQLDGSPTEEDFEGVSEGLIIALECGGYPVTDLFSGHVELAYAGHGGDRLAGDSTLRKTNDALRFIQKNLQAKITILEERNRDLGRDLIDARAKLNRNEMIQHIEKHGYIS
jgi:hypothetical protein